MAANAKPPEKRAKHIPYRNILPNEKLFSKNEIEEYNITRAKISPDGKYVAYQRTLVDPSESAQMTYPLFSKPTGGGEPVALTPGVYYIDEFWWSPDSKEIYYTEYDFDVDDPHPSKLMAVSATGGKARTVLDSPGYLHDCSSRPFRAACGLHLREHHNSP